MRVRDDLFDDPISPLRVGARDAIAQRMTLDVLDLVDEVALLFVKEGLTIADEELEVSDLRSIVG